MLSQGRATPLCVSTPDAFFVNTHAASVISAAFIPAPTFIRYLFFPLPTLIVTVFISSLWENVRQVFALCTIALPQSTMLYHSHESRDRSWVCCPLESELRWSTG